VRRQIHHQIPGFSCWILRCFILNGALWWQSLLLFTFSSQAVEVGARKPPMLPYWQFSLEALFLQYPSSCCVSAPGGAFPSCVIQLFQIEREGFSSTSCSSSCCSSLQRHMSHRPGHDWMVDTALQGLSSQDAAELMKSRAVEQWHLKGSTRWCNCCHCLNSKLLQCLDHISISNLTPGIITITAVCPWRLGLCFRNVNSLCPAPT
jgi:hypothetical protein